MDHPAAVPAIWPVTSRNLCRFARYAPSKSSRWRKATSDDPTAHSQSPAPGPGPRADRCTRGTQMTISHGGLKLAVCAVVGALGLAACSQGSSSSNSVSTTSGGFGSVPAASGTAHAGTITWAESPGTRADLDLPRGAGPPTAPCIHPTTSSMRDVAAAVLVHQRRPADRNAVDEHGQPAGVLQRRQDRHHPAEDELPLVGRPAGDLQGRAVLPRRGAGRREGERRQLEPVHPARRDTRPGGQRHHAQLHHAGDQPEQAGQPAVDDRERARS